MIKNDVCSRGRSIRQKSHINVCIGRGKSRHKIPTLAKLVPVAVTWAR